MLADIRLVPRSRRNPQFKTDVLAAGLADVGIEYVRLPGSRRVAPPTSRLAELIGKVTSAFWGCLPLLSEVTEASQLRLAGVLPIRPSASSLCEPRRQR